MAGGACVAEGGVHGRGSCMAGGHAWQGVGACMAGGMCGRGGTCMAGGVDGMHAPPDTTSGTHPTGMHSCLKIRPV